MAAPKGNSFAGSRKGVKNKKTTQWEAFSQYCLEGGLKKFQEEMSKLRGKDFVQAFTAILEFNKPKLARTEMKVEGEVKHTIATKTQFQIKPKGK